MAWRLELLHLTTVKCEFIIHQFLTENGIITVNKVSISISNNYPKRQYVVNSSYNPSLAGNDYLRKTLGFNGPLGETSTLVAFDVLE